MIREHYAVFPITFIVGFVFGKSAITFGRHIFYVKKEVSKTLRRHEAKHVEQYARHGIPGFLARYLWYSLRYGYRNNPLEIEARNAEY